MAAAYVAGLWYVCDDMYKNLKTNPHPFDDSWLLWPVAGTLGYLAVLYVGTKIMANRQEVDVKHHMFTYNIYQVSLSTSLMPSSDMPNRQSRSGKPGLQMSFALRESPLPLES